MKLLETGSAEYRAAFEASLRFGRSSARLPERLDELLRRLPVREVAVDWGAGGGRATQLLCERFDRVYAVEPSAEMRRSISTEAPGAIVVAESLQSAVLPEPVDFGLINQVLYHVPEKDWGEQTLRCAEQLSEKGLLCVSLKHPAGGCGELFEHFGAERFDLYRLVDTLRNQFEFTFEFINTAGRIETSSFDDTLTVARFVLSDRPEGAFTRLGTETEFRSYVRERFWDEASGRGGWPFPSVHLILRRNPFSAS